MTRWTGFAFIGVSLAVFSSVAMAQNAPEALQGSALRSALTEAANELDAAGFGGHVSVMMDGEIVFASSLGPADPVSGAPYHLLTQTDTGSIAKPFTGLLAASLVADERVDPQTSLSDWFDDVPEEMAGITLHQLLTHSAGLPAAIGPDYENISREEYRARTFATGLDFQPGERFSYSNVGFTLAAMILEEASDQDYQTLLRQNILEPLKLDDTGFENVVSEARSVRNRSGQSIPAASWGQALPSWHLIGNGGLVSTPADMLSFGQFLMQTEGPATSLMVQPHMSEGRGTPSSYGYGIVLENDPQFGRVIWHNGGNPHFVNHLRMLPDANAVIFTTSNQASNPDIAAHVLTAAVFGQHVDIPRAPEFDRSQTVALPATPQGSLARLFFTAVDSEDSTVWQNFLETHASTAFIALAPMEAHLGMFQQLHGDLATARLHAVEDRPGEILLIVSTENGPVLSINLGFELRGDEAILNGLGVDVL